jgi:hypothetical protein
MKARKIIEAETPKSVFKAFSKSNAGRNEQEILDRFKRSAIAYIRWIDPPDPGSGCAGFDMEDIRQLSQAKTFQEAEAVLAAYDSDPSFLSMIAQGYFV